MFRVCVDTGGTFTESIVLDEKGNFYEFKSSTTPSDFSEGVINTLVEAASAFSLSREQFLKQTEWIVHGTTVATNALIQRKLARTAMITTKGFRDIIEMRRALKIETHSMYEGMIPPYEPIVPRYLRFTVDEETRYTGEITRPLNEDELKSVTEKIRKEGVEAVAICFINSYANPENEIRAAEICKSLLDGVFVTCSSDILPKMGEYERESTCVISASLGPIVSKYLNNLESKLRQSGFTGQLLIVQANQYVQSVSAITRKPVYLTGSGPAAGPAGAVYLGNAIGEPNFLTGDMGGTSWDASLVKNGQVSLKAGEWLGDDRLGIKVADVISIGAGGGSIGWLDPLGLLRVGPLSAGAEPGPACYGKGGKEPTVTDAALILGYLNPDNFCGGKIKLNVYLARAAMKKIAEPLKMSIEEAAQAIFTTVNHNMADGITEISTRKGYDVRDFSLLAMGGGGGLCGVFIADLLGMRKTIVPKFAASFCAWSMFFLDVGRDYVRSYICPLSVASPDAMNQLYQEMIAQALDEFAALKVSRKDLVINRYAEVRYLGQYHEVEVSLDAENIASRDIEQVAKEFHRKHEELYTFSLPWVPLEFRNLRLIAKVRTDKIALKKIGAGTKDPSEALKRKRKSFFDGSYVETPVYDSFRLKSGNIISGPAVIEEPVTTVVIPKGFRCHIDDYGNYVTSSSPKKLKTGEKMVQADNITVATIWHYLQRVCVEMRETMERTAANVLTTSLHDLSYGIWDAEGRAIAFPEGFASRLISSTFPIKAVLRRFSGKIYPGDVFMTNHPFIAGAAHLPDWVFIRPIFYKGELVFFSCMGTHVPDNGGAQPGSFWLAYDAIAEGLNIPPIKVMEKGQEREDVIDFILCNNRMPDLMRREMHSLIGSTMVAERRLTELLNKYGKQTVSASIEEMINRTEKAVRAEIAKWPDGTYYAEAQTDDDGAELGVPVTVRCKLTIKGDEMTFDYSGSDEQRKGNINKNYPATMSSTICASFSFMNPALSAYHNEGSLRPIHVIAPEGTVVNARPGSLMACTPPVGGMIVECVFSLLSQALPERAIAPYGKLPGPGTTMGIDPRTKELYAYVTFNAAGGAGAVHGSDGYQCCCDMAVLGAVTKSDTEEQMVRFPWRVTKYEFRTDSAGAGKWRGAPGIIWETINEGGECSHAGGSSDGLHTQPKGQQGGYPSPFNVLRIMRGAERIDVKHLHEQRQLKAGDVVIGESGGGAGVGPPEERDPEAVKMDVKNELVSIKAARDIYKVVLDPGSLKIDYDATKSLRAKH